MLAQLRLTMMKSLERRWNLARYPGCDPALRIALLTPDTSLRQIARRTRKCKVVAGTVPMLRWLTEAVTSGAVSLPQLEGAVAYTGIQHEELTDLERDRFWQVLETPVREHRLGPDGRVIAMECEANELHLLDRDEPLTGLRLHLDTTPCECGNAQPRLRHIERMPRPSGAPTLIRATVPTYIDDHRDEEHDQVHPAGRVA